MIELYINGQKCDIDQDTEIAISSAVTDGYKTIKGSWSKTFTIPATARNRANLNYVEILQSEKGIDKNTLAEGILRNGIEIIKGKVIVESVTIDNTNLYEINIISGNKSWVAEIGEKTLQDLDFADGDFVYNVAIVNTFGNVQFPLIDFGEIMTTNGAVDLMNYRPAYKVGWILQKAFTKLTSYQVDYPDLFDKLFIPHTTRFALPEDTINNLHAKLWQDTEQAKTSFTTLNFETITFAYELDDAGNHVSGSVYTADFTGFLRFYITLNYASEAGGGNLEFVILHSDGSYNTVLDVNFPSSYPAGSYYSNEPTLDVWVENGKTYKLAVRGSKPNVAYKDTYLEIERLDSYFYGETVQLNDIMPKWSIKDMIAGLNHLFNLLFEVDKTNNTVKIQTENDFYSGGSFQTIQPLKSGDIKISWFDTSKKIIFGYKNDSNDWAAKQYKIDDLGIFDKTFEFQNRISDETKKDLNPFFAPTLMRQITEIDGLEGYMIPYMKKSETAGYDSEGYQPRLLYFDNEVFYKDYDVSFFSQTQHQTQIRLMYSYFDPANSQFTPTNYPINLSFNEKFGVEGLLSKYHKNKLKRLDVGKIVELSIKITLKEYNELSFADTYVINDPDFHEINGNYHLLEIKDFNPGKETVKLKLVQAFKTSADYTPPATIEDTDPVNIRSRQSGISYENGNLVLINNFDKVAEVGKTGLTSTYDDLYFDEGGIKPLYYIDGQTLKKLKQ